MHVLKLPPSYGPRDLAGIWISDICHKTGAIGLGAGACRCNGTGMTWGHRGTVSTTSGVDVRTSGAALSTSSDPKHRAMSQTPNHKPKYRTQQKSESFSEPHTRALNERTDPEEVKMATPEVHESPPEVVEMFLRVPRCPEDIPVPLHQTAPACTGP